MIAVGTIGRLRVGLTPNRAMGFRGPLDLFGATGASFSTRRLRGGYAGASMRVRRSSDNAEIDIQFTPSGDLDTVALMAHCGAGSGFVTTWYDQSGNSRDVSQATAASQPRIVLNGVLNTINGKPAVFFNSVAMILFNNTAFLYSQGSAMANVVMSSGATIDRRVVSEGSSTSGNPIYSLIQNHLTTPLNSSAYIRNTAASVVFNSSTTVLVDAFNSTPTVASHIDTGTSIAGYMNGTAGASTAYTRSGSVPLDRFAIGGLMRSSSSSFLGGNLCEVITSEVPSDASRQTLERNQGAFFGVTVA